MLTRRFRATGCSTYAIECAVDRSERVHEEVHCERSHEATPAFQVENVDGLGHAEFIGVEQLARASIKLRVASYCPATRLALTASAASDVDCTLRFCYADPKRLPQNRDGRRGRRDAPGTPAWLVWRRNRGAV